MQHAERGLRRSEDGRRSVTGLKPTKTLFVINFDPYDTRVKDLERHFEPYGEVLNVRIRRNFAFIHYGSQEEATKAFDATHMRLVKCMSVTFCLNELFARSISFV